jgi:MoaA/NifB/PqqE/SkfB family radical SAM enzyme
MTCGHCCFSCTGKGSFMTAEVFEKALEIAKEYSQMVTLGGGEPTLHPQCEKWAMQAALELVDVSLDADSPAVMIITNGKRGKVAEKLAKLTKLGVIQAELSQDRFHDPIDPKTVETFKRYAHIRDVTNGGRGDVIGVGRASEDDNIPTREGCACSTLFIAPNGDFYGCGCKYKKLGNILTDEVGETYWDHAEECHRELAEREAVEA